jgi:prepilin-type processing-associated H-X9-DG protein
MLKNASKLSRGFTLIESLVIATTCSLLLTLALPGLLHARQQAVQQTCKNNLKQLGLALHNYHDVFNSFPPAWCIDHFDASSRAAFGWQASLLPYVDQAGLYNQINYHQPDWTIETAASGGRSIAGSVIAKTVLPVYLCPQDSTGGTNPFRDDYGTSNYSGNAGSELLPRWFESSAEQFWPGGANTPTVQNGIFVVNGKIGFRSITDGSSNTVMVSERSAYSGAGLWIGVRSNRHENDVMSDMNYITGVNKSWSGLSGRHNGALNMLLCDGSVRLVKEDIDSQPEGGILQALSTRAGGEIVGEF